MKSFIATTLIAATLFPAASSATSTSYAGQETRDIKSLSQEDINGYLAGKGMGFAKAAELNGYPGPMHVLELASELQLTPEQQAKTKQLFDAMQVKASMLGRELVAAEQKLDRLFAGRSANTELLDNSLKEIGALQAKVRGAHLEAHLTQAEILTAEQTARYLTLRGYGKQAATGVDHGSHGGRHKH
ncbi:MAG TPA: periplasmic heavy metal sensor [Noviherbaspirillum sp.]|jgi:Spy/CpxP family protein refolding chaperone|uniref:Spy/CpxP family protein refolding chaperone n=1 Tax=Noviherbaspirillum sp. TaxID=1926288 RepID=UPI002DDD112D|nr:periplasmic heavy metal sensor [Noviherbaspirillum sp.]HEV2611441.1 periplasmic heavy metal sensor [Noviherbaspirillum sp.]